MSTQDQTPPSGKAVYEARPPLPESAYARRAPLPAPSPVPERRSFGGGLLVILERMAYAFTLVGAAMGGVEFVLIMKHAQSAPQQAGGGAMALCWAIIPYVFARAMTGLRRAGEA